MSFVDPNSLPGVQAAIETTEVEFLFGDLGFHRVIGVQLYSGAVDSTNTPTTTLRKGLVLGKITASGLYTNYAATATDGSQEPKGFLYEPRNMLNRNTGTAENKPAQMMYWGGAKVASLGSNFDEYTRRVLSNRIIFDDLRQLRGGFNGPTAKTADYTVLSTDDDMAFTTTGASGAVNFTLPATVVKGFRARFTNTVNQNMVVTAPANKLIGTNSATLTTITFSTANEKLGSSVEITVDDTGTKYIAHVLSNTTATFA